MVISFRCFFLKLILLYLEWRPSELTHLHGSTQQCRGVVGKHNFGHRARFDMVRNWHSVKVTAPQLLFQVFNVSFWGRRTAAGYGFIPLPLVHGCSSTDVATWRPQISRGMRLYEYFLGIAPQLENLTYVGIPSNVILSKTSLPFILSLTISTFAGTNSRKIPVQH